MPYSGASDPNLPSNVRKLPANKRRQWIAVFNSAFAKCRVEDGSDCEAAAFRQANGVALSEGRSDVDDEQQLTAATDEIKAIVEAGRVLSARSRAAVEQMKTLAEKLSYHPMAKKITEMCDELLASAEPVTESADDEPVVEAYDELSAMPGMPDGYRGKKACPNCAATMETTAGTCPECSADMHDTSRVLASAMRESVQIIEAVQGTKGREWDVILIEAGLSLNGRYYPPEVLKAAAPLFEGRPAFADHATDEERRTRPERSVRDKVGIFRNVQYGSFNVAGRVIEGLKARFKVVDQQLRDQLKEAVEMGEPGFLGFSIDAEGRVIRKPHNGKTVDWVEQIVKVSSVDVVTDPAAGGQVMRLVAANRQEITKMGEDEIKRLIQETMKETMSVGLADAVKEQVGTVITEALRPTADGAVALAETVKQLQEQNRRQALSLQVDTALAEPSGLSDIGKARLRESFRALAERRDFTADELKESIDQQVAYEAALVQQFANPRSIARAQVGDSEADKHVKSLLGWFRGNAIDGVPMAQGLQESYCRWNGLSYWDFNAQDMMDEMGRTPFRGARSHKQITESLTTSSWTQVFADVMHQALITEFREYPLDDWRKIVSNFDNPPDFRARHWMRVGGYGDLASVAEQGTYPTLTTPNDEEVTFTLTKFGGIDDVTMETLLGDKVNKVRGLPREMSRAAKRTLYKDILDLVTTDNPTMDYDTTALYTSHNNSGTTALTLDGWSAVVTAMRDQTRYGTSAEVLGPINKPKIIIVPNELTYLAKRMFSPSMNYVLSPTASSDGSIDPNAFREDGIEIITYDYLTDANNWWAVADPNLVGTVVVGFLNGQQEPELFVQDEPTVGSVFSADKVSFKIRFIYGFECLEHRSFYRQVVA